MTNTTTTTRNAELFDGIADVGDVLTDGRTIIEAYWDNGFRYIVADFLCGTHGVPMCQGYPRFCVACDTNT